MAANQTELGHKIAESLKPYSPRWADARYFCRRKIFRCGGVQKPLDARIRMNMVGDMGRYTQFQVANSMPNCRCQRRRRRGGCRVGLEQASPWPSK